MPKRRSVSTIPERLRELEFFVSRLKRCCPDGYSFVVDPEGVAAGLYVRNDNTGNLTRVGG